MNEAMKQALEKIANVNAMDYEYQRWAREALAIAELESQEPMGWHLIEALYPQGERLDIRMGDGSILCNLLPQADGDLWWDGSGTGEKFIDPVYADVTHWRIHSNTHPPQRKPLTDEQILNVARDHYNPYQRPEISFARAIEAAHGIKE